MTVLHMVFKIHRLTAAFSYLLLPSFYEFVDHFRVVLSFFQVFLSGPVNVLVVSIMYQVGSFI